MTETTTTTSASIEREGRVHVSVYARQPLTIVRGEGCRVWDDAGNQYLDLVAGIAVNVLGHAHPAVADALAQQARTLLTTSNLYYTVPQLELADALIARSPFDRAFFTNSGTEANEAAIKLARRFGGHGRHEVVTAYGSFHGRTLATLHATGQPAMRAWKVVPSLAQAMYSVPYFGRTESSVITSYWEASITSPLFQMGVRTVPSSRMVSPGQSLEGSCRLMRPGRLRVSILKPNFPAMRRATSSMKR